MNRRLKFPIEPFEFTEVVNGAGLLGYRFDNQEEEFSLLDLFGDLYTVFLIVRGQLRSIPTTQPMGWPQRTMWSRSSGTWPSTRTTTQVVGFPKG